MHLCCQQTVEVIVICHLLYYMPQQKLLRVPMTVANLSIFSLDVGKFCHKPTNTCFIYASLPACSHQIALDFLRNESCTESYWIFNSDMQRFVRFYSHVTAMKSFSFDYKYFSCQECKYCNGLRWPTRYSAPVRMAFPLLGHPHPGRAMREKEDGGLITDEISIVETRDIPG